MAERKKMYFDTPKGRTWCYEDELKAIGYMTNDKFYIPDISEFYVGFEYESNGVPAVSDGTDIERLIFVESIWKNIRVKYLDREDIESLGFEKDSGDYDYIKGKYQLEIYPTLYGKGLCLHITDDYGNCLLFHGTIKNKSELRTILRMIGV